MIGDCTSTPEGVFLSHKPQECDKTVMERISKLLDAYDCFRTDNAMLGCKHSFGQEGQERPRYSNSFFPRGGMTNYMSKRNPRLRSHHHNDATMPKFNVGMAHSERQVRACLNKMTHQNYKKMSVAVLAIIKDNGIQPTLDFVLEKCYTQVCFMDLFMCLLCDIYESCGQVDQSDMETVLREFVESFLRREEFLLFQLKHTANYSEFCDTILQRNVLIGQHKTILALMTHLLDKESKETYFATMFKIFINFTGSHEIYELLLDFITDCCKHDSRYASKIKTYFEVEKTDWRETSNKARYKIMDMIAAC
jgi:hypothetical protein